MLDTMLLAQRLLNLPHGRYAFRMRLTLPKHNKAFAAYAALYLATSTGAFTENLHSSTYLALILAGLFQHNVDDSQSLP
jgi:hypothetical protein